MYSPIIQTLKTGSILTIRNQLETVEEDNTIWPDFAPSGDFTPWEHVQLARAKTRPTGKDYIEALFDDFMEFHGDRHCGDDPAVIGGVAIFPRTAGNCSCTGKRRGYKGKYCPEFRNGFSGGVLEIPASDAAGREISPSGDLSCRYTRCILRVRSRGTWTG